jgi:hypothetical protein
MSTVASLLAFVQVAALAVLALYDLGQMFVHRFSRLSRIQSERTQRSVFSWLVILSGLQLQVLQHWRSEEPFRSWKLTWYVPLLASLSSQQQLMTRSKGAIASPRIGNAALANAITNQGMGGQSRNYRVSHRLDSVPNAPDRTLFPAFVHIDPVYIIDSASGATASINDIRRDDNSTLKDNDVPLRTTFNQRIDAHTWYFNNISLCNTATTGRVAYPFANLTEVIRYTEAQSWVT